MAIAQDSTEAITAPAVISGIVVTVDGSWGQEAQLADMARELIGIREGDPFCPERVQTALSALKLSRQFEYIEVNSREENGRMVLEFTLRPFRYIKNIRIYGKYPLFEKQVLNAMTLYAGDVYDAEKLDSQRQLIAELFRRNGFTGVRVETAARQDPDDGNYEVDVNISDKDYFRLDSIRFEGNRAFPAGRLKMKMAIWRRSFRPWSGGRFVEEQLAADVKRLTEFYRHKGYADARIQFGIERRPDTRRVQVTIRIEEGPLYSVRIRGNSEFRNRTLKKDLVLFTGGNRGGTGVRKSVRNIRDRYQREGYPDVQVKAVPEPAQMGAGTQQDLTFDIHEGPRAIVRSIRISGNVSVDTESIRKQMLTSLPGLLSKGAFDSQVLEDDLNAIRSLYRTKGFLDVKAGSELSWSEDRTGVDIRIDIDEQVQTLVSSMAVTGLPPASAGEALDAVKLKEGQPYRSYMVKSGENAIASVIAEKGYPHVEVGSRTEFSPDRNSAQVLYDVEEGPRVQMGHTWFSGNFRTRERILENEIELEPGEPFSLTRVFESQRNLRNLNCIDSVRIKTIGLKEKQDTVNLIVQVEEKKPWVIQAGAGYQSDKGLYVNGKAGDRNLFGINVEGWISGEASEVGHRYDLSVSEPRLLGSKTSAGFSLYSERSAPFNLDFETLSYGWALNFGRSWTPKLSSGLNFRFEEREQRPNNLAESLADTDMGSEFDNRQVLTVTPSARYDSRDSFIRPKKGIYSTLAVDVSKGIKNVLDDFTKTRLDVRLYWSPAKRLTIAWLNRAGYIEPFGEFDTVPDDQLFYLGGTQDVRGFKENMLRYDSEGNPLGGRVALAESLEARIDLGRNFEFALFADAGSVTDRFGDITSDTIRTSAGLGLRYITPIGAMGILYGAKLDRREGESAGRLHFSIGYTF